MKIESKISVGNNSTLGFDSVRVSTPCHGFISVFIPVDGGKREIEVELKRTELVEFLIRTQPAFAVELAVNSKNTTDVCQLQTK